MIIPQEIQNILNILKNSGFDAFIVGGCVRDFLYDKIPNDWDITTNAKPEQIQEIFEKAGYSAVYENDFGTVGIITQSEDPSLKNVEITPFRIESKYTDKRHPDEVKWAKTLEEDLNRRDFTVNAIALSLEFPTTNYKPQTTNYSSLPPTNYQLIDLFDGQTDIKNHLIRAVGKPEDRFQEDALRMIRAIRLAVCLGQGKPWNIEEKTQDAIIKNGSLLSFISQERIRDELVKIIMSKSGARGIELLRRYGLLSYIIPELLLGFGISQNKHHIFQIYQHNLLALNYACRNNFSFEARLSALLHDIGKPQTKRGEGENSTFYNHEIVGAKITNQILRRLRFSAKETAKIVKLVKHHLFYYNVDEVGPSSVRRLLRKVGQEDIEELLQVRYADRIGSGVPKAEPYKLRHMKYLFDKVAQDPIIPKMMAVKGEDVMEILNIRQGVKVGQVLTYLLSQVLADPTKNTREYLLSEIKKIKTLPEEKFAELFQKAQKYIEETKTKKDTMTKKKYWVT